MMKGQWLGVLLGFVIIFLVIELRHQWATTSSVYWSFVGLDGDDTAYDYLSAPVGTQVHFTAEMCNDGVCLAKLDWRCGFTIRSHKFEHEKYLDWHEAVDDCFGKLVSVVPVHTSLDRVRKICGRHYMQFDPEPTANREECEADGGTWGVAKPLWSDEQALLGEAGID